MSLSNTLIDLASWLLLLSGSGFLIVGSIGIIRFPDFWSRLHAAAIVDSAGMALLVAGMVLQSGLTIVTIKLILIGLFLLVTGPTATHAVANAAYVSGSRPLGYDDGHPVRSADIVEAVAQADETGGEQPS